MQHKKLQNVSCKATFNCVTIRATMTSAKKSSEELQREFGSWIKLQRKMAGLVQGTVSVSAPIDRVHLARIESGESGTKRDTVISIVEAINQKSTTGHKVDVNEALDRFYGRWKEKGQVSQSDIDELAKRLAEGTMAAGFDDLTDSQLREDFLADMQTIAESMLKRKLEEQEKRKKQNKYDEK